jgi:hypothetical protein
VKLHKALVFLLLLTTNFVWAEKPVIQLVIKDHLFYPSELLVPANKKIKLIVDNQDSTPEEFESYELNREKVILGNSKAVIFIGPLAPGEYPFFGEFNMATAQGKLIAK